MPSVADTIGELRLFLFDTSGSGSFDRYQLRLAPPDGGDTCSFSAYRLVAATEYVSVSGDGSVTIELPADSNDPFCDGGATRFTEVSGTVLLGGDAVERVFPGFADADVGRRGAGTDTTGAFSIDLVDGTYDMDAFWTFPVDVYPRLRLDSTEPVVVVENRDPIDLGTFDVPLEDFTVTVLDLDGRPIEGVDVSTPVAPTATFEMNGFGFTGTSDFPGSPSTDAAGVAVLPLLAGGPYTLRFSPPAGFEPIELGNVEVLEGGSTLQVQLAYPHAPPTATIGLSGDQVATDTFTGDVTVDITPVVADGFSPASVEVTVDGGTPLEYTGPFAVSGVGDHDVTWPRARFRSKPPRRRPPTPPRRPLRPRRATRRRPPRTRSPPHRRRRRPQRTSRESSHRRARRRTRPGRCSRSARVRSC